VAFGLAPGGGNVVIPSHEFPANVYPWLRVETLGGPEVRLVEIPDRRVTAGVLSAAVDDETRVIAVSSVDYLSGFRPDLAMLRELADDALLVVDAIQGLGAIRQTLAPADVMVAGGQKWMRAGWGSGVLAVSRRAVELLHPSLTGWWGVVDAFAWENLPPHAPRPDAERFQDGTPPLFGASAIEAAIEVIEAEGMGAIESAVMENVALLEEVLLAAGAELLDPWETVEERSGILSFRLSEEPSTTTVQRLAAAGVFVSERLGWVRVSPHATTDPDISGLLAEVLKG